MTQKVYERRGTSMNNKTPQTLKEVRMEQLRDNIIFCTSFLDKMLNHKDSDLWEDEQLTELMKLQRKSTRFIKQMV